MFTGRLPALLSLPLMAFLMALGAGIPFPDILSVVLKDGAVRLAPAFTTVMFGAVLAVLIYETGIAEYIIKRAAEFSGDNPLFISFFLVAIVAVLFTTLGGLGAVIMVATLVFPVLLSVGIPPLLAGCIFLMGLSLGGTFNVANWVVYKEVLGLSISEISAFALKFGVCFAVVVFLFLVLEIRRTKRSSFWALSSDARLSPLSFATPVLPVLLVLIFSKDRAWLPGSLRFDFPILPAMMTGIVWGLLTTKPKEGSRANLLSKCILKGVSDSAPAVALIIGIGMVVSLFEYKPAGADTTLVSQHLSPYVSSIFPRGPLGYVLFFTIFAPLALYRGPLNVWGMGMGIAGLLKSLNLASPGAIMAALLSVGMIQGVCDPTNTHNVWIANFLKVDVGQILKKTLPWMWVLAVMGLILGAVGYF